MSDAHARSADIHDIAVSKTGADRMIPGQFRVSIKCMRNFRLHGKKCLTFSRLVNLLLGLICNLLLAANLISKDLA